MIYIIITYPSKQQYGFQSVDKVTPQIFSRGDFVYFDWQKALTTPNYMKSAGNVYI